MNSFLIKSLKDYLEKLKFNSNYIKLYYDNEEEETKKNLNDNPINEDIFYEINKLSRTPAYGIKKIVFTTPHSNELTSLRPIQIMMLFFSKHFYNCLIKNKFSDSFTKYLDMLNLNKELYSINKNKLINNFYVLNKSDKKITIKSLKKHDYYLLFHKYFGMKIKNFKFLFKFFDEFKASNKLNVSFIENSTYRGLILNSSDNQNNNIYINKKNPILNIVNEIKQFPFLSIKTIKDYNINYLLSIYLTKIS